LILHSICNFALEQHLTTLQQPKFVFVFLQLQKICNEIRVARYYFGKVAATDENVAQKAQKMKTFTYLLATRHLSIASLFAAVQSVFERVDGCSS